MALVVIVSPLGRGQFEARLEGRVLVGSTTEPLLAAARVLLAEGAPPDTPIAMRHAGSEHDALRATVGRAARLTVEAGKDGCPRFARWRKAVGDAGNSPPVRRSGLEVRRQPSAPDALYGASTTQPSGAVP